MARKSDSRYSVTLAERFPAPKKGKDPFTEKFRTEWYDRLMLLFDHYDVPRPPEWSAIDYNHWRHLALSLAFHNVPGFQTKKPGGRTKTWGDHQCMKLYIDVTLSVRSGQTESQACYHLAQKEPWRSFVQSRKADQKSIGKTLLRKYKGLQEQNHPVVELVKQTEEQCPKEIGKNLRIASERLNW